MALPRTTGVVPTGLTAQFSRNLQITTCKRGSTRSTQESSHANDFGCAAPVVLVASARVVSSTAMYLQEESVPRVQQVSPALSLGNCCLLEQRDALPQREIAGGEEEVVGILRKQTTHGQIGGQKRVSDKLGGGGVQGPIPGGCWSRTTCSPPARRGR